MRKPTSNQAKELKQLHSRFWHTLTRTYALIHVATGLGTDDDPPELSAEGEDIIRAMIVFLYASIEDFLRELVRILYERLSGGRLDKIQIRVGSKNFNTIGLGTLARHPDKLFADVVRDSVNNWLTDKNFSNVPAVRAILRDLEVKIEKNWTDYFKSLGQLMRRRHRIVHKADLSKPTDVRPKKFTLHESQMILGWFHDVDFFVTELVISLLPTKEAAPMSKKLTERKKQREEFETRRDKTADQDAES